MGARGSRPVLEGGRGLGPHLQGNGKQGPQAQGGRAWVCRVGVASALALGWA